MHSINHRLFIFIALLLLWIPSARPNPDSMEMAALQPYLNKQAIHWDIVKASPQWIKGVKPEYHWPWQMHRVHLQAGEQSSFYLPAYQSLRLYNPERPLKPADINVYLSNGTGLLKEVNLQASSDNHSVLISPQSSSPEVIYIRHTGKPTTAVEAAVFISRRDSLKNITPYPDLKWLSGKWVGLSQKPLQIAEIYWHLTAHRPEWVNIKGPARIQLKNRLQYEKLASALIQNYRIQYRLNDNPAVWLNFATSAESNRQLFINTRKQTLGREQQAYIDIPAGQHRLQLMSDRNLFLQVRQQNGQADYLLPYFNQPPLAVEDIIQQGQLNEQPLVNSFEYIQDILPDNRRQSSALAATQTLKQSALQRMDYPRGLAEAEKIKGHHTFFRDLLPAVKQSTSPHFKAYFVNQRLNKISNRQRHAHISDQHQAAALNRLGNATFTPLKSGSSADSYLLQPRSSSTLLRLIVDKRQCTTSRFKLQMDQQPAKTFTVHCQPDINSNNAFKQSISEIALEQVQLQSGSLDNPTLSHLFSANHLPAKLIPVAVNEILLPQQVQQIKVWNAGSDNQTINLALQVRAAKVYQYSEQSYLARLYDIPKTDLFKLFISDLPTTDISDFHYKNSGTEQQLLNQWVPLKQYLNGLYRQYNHSVSAPIPARFAANPLELLVRKKLAKQAEQNLQWTEAVKHWTSVIEASKGKVRDQAQLAQANNLAQLSELYLAQSLWRYLTLYGDKDVAEKAKSRLLTAYQNQRDEYAVQMMAAALFIQQPDYKNLGFLVENLMQNKHYRYAIMLGQLLPDPPESVTLQIIKAAYHLQWWQTFQQQLSQLPVDQQWFWKGMKSQKTGNYTAALKQWRQSKANHWSRHLQQGLNLAKRLSRTANQKPVYHQLYKDWNDWQQDHPGDWVWQNANTYIKDAAGVDQYYAIERDLYSTLFRGNSQRPVKLQVMGPVKLNFKIRLLHQTPDSRLNGWLKITDNHQPLHYPFLNNKVVQGVLLTGNQHYLPGNWVTLEYQVGQGFHEIELSSDQAPVSVAVSEYKKEFPLSVLAPLNIDSFQHALKPVQLADTEIKKLVNVTPSKSLAISEQQLSMENLFELSGIKNTRQAELRMMTCYALFEQQNTAELMYLAEQIHKRFPDTPLIKRLWNRISSHTEWKTVNAIDSSAGMHFIETQGWNPGSTPLKIRKALIPQTKADEHIVFGHKRLLMMMTNLRAKSITAEVLLDDIDFLPNSPAVIKYQLNQQTPKEFHISRADDWKKIQLRIPAGHHQVRFWFESPVSNLFLRIRFQNHNNDMHFTEEKSFFVSTKTDPLKVYIKGPATIRIDEWLNNTVSSSYQNVVSGWQLLTIPPNNKQQESLFRIKQRSIKANPNAIMARNIKRILKPVLPPAIQFSQHETEQASSVTENSFSISDPTSGTWSLGTQLQRRNNIQEDSSRGVSEQFQQFHFNYRYFDRYNDTFWDTLGFVRIREQGNPSFGFKQAITFQPDYLPFNINLEAKTITQIVQSDPEWLGQFKIALSQSAHLTPKTSITPKLSWSGRYMSLRDSDKVRKDGGFINSGISTDVDKDLYTSYKAQHTSSLNASLLVTHKPWLDTVWTAKFKSVSNENMNIFNPDHFTTSAHWKQLIGKVSLDASYRISFYQKDKDRSNSSKRHSTQLKFNWLSWTNQSNWFDVGIQYNYDIDRKAHLGFVSFNYHFGENKGFRDYKPGKIDFRHIRERQRLDERD